MSDTLRVSHDNWPNQLWSPLKYVLLLEGVVHSCAEFSEKSLQEKIEKTFFIL